MNQAAAEPRVYGTWQPSKEGVLEVVRHLMSTADTKHVTWVNMRQVSRGMKVEEESSARETKLEPTP